MIRHDENHAYFVEIWKNKKLDESATVSDKKKILHPCK
jgi:hypothetical protein